MQAEAILAPAVSFPPAVEVPDNLEATTPEEEFEAWEGERVAIEEYNSDRGVL